MSFCSGKFLSATIAVLSLFLLLSTGCRQEKTGNAKIFRTSINKLIATLDPALAADTACQFMTASFYDTPLQYSFTKRPYTLEPSMLTDMPEFSPDGSSLTCRLRSDLLFQKALCFPGDNARKVTADDVIFSILRLADARVQSTGYWLVRGRIKGLEEFRARTANLPEQDLSPFS